MVPREGQYSLEEEFEQDLSTTSFSCPFIWNLRSISSKDCTIHSGHLCEVSRQIVHEGNWEGLRLRLQSWWLVAACQLALTRRDGVPGAHTSRCYWHSISPHPVAPCPSLPNCGGRGLSRLLEKSFQVVQTLVFLNWTMEFWDSPFCLANIFSVWFPTSRGFCSYWRDYSIHPFIWVFILFMNFRQWFRWMWRRKVEIQNIRKKPEGRTGRNCRWIKWAHEFKVIEVSIAASVALLPSVTVQSCLYLLHVMRWIDHSLFWYLKVSVKITPIFFLHFKILAFAIKRKRDRKRERDLFEKQVHGQRERSSTWYFMP